MKKASKKFLALLVSVCLLCMISSTALVSLAETPLQITGVGIFDQTPNKGIHTFNADAKLIQVTFNKDFWPQEQSYVELDALVNLKMLINGKTPSQWVGDYGSDTWGCVTAHVKRSDALGQYLEINMTGVAGLPTESSDNTIQFLSGFAGSLESDVAYYYTANNNVPFTTEKPATQETTAPTTTTTAAPVEVDLAVTGVGIFDQTPNKGIHTFNANAKLIQVTFNGNFYNTDELSGGTKQWIQSELGNYIKINGKTVAEWNADEFNSVQIHVKTNEALGGQFLEFNMSGLSGLPTQSTDGMFEFLAGFPNYYGDDLAESVTYYYVADKNVPYVTEKPADFGGNYTTTTQDPSTTTTTQAPSGGDDDEEFQVLEVGVLDTDPKGAYVDFGDTDLFQVKFNKDLYTGSDPMVSADKLKTFVQAQYGDYIAINGKTVTEWNQKEYNCVVIHIGKTDILGQYFEFNVNETIDGLFNGTHDNTITFLKGLPAGDGTKLQENVTFKLAADSKQPFVKQDVAEEITPPTTTAPVDPSTIDLEITAVGVLDQSPKKALHDFGSSFLWQIDFNKDFYDVSELNENGRKDHIQSEIGDYIIINGKSVTQWNMEVFNSVQIHVQTNPSFGQYLEMNTNAMLDGLVFPETDNVVTILAGFPCANGEALKESVSFFMEADSNVPFVKLDEPVLPEVTTTTANVSSTTTTVRFDIVGDDDETDVPDTGVVTSVLPVAIVLLCAVSLTLVLRKKQTAE